MNNIIKAYATKNLCYIASQKMIPKGIVVHSTAANNPRLSRYVDSPEEVGENIYGNHWNNPTPDNKMICVHAFIGYDKNGEIRVAEILPLNICCWGVDEGIKGSYNYDPAYIQFEICEDGLTDRSYYDKVFDVAAEYCAHLCKTYGIKNSNIVGHCEAYLQGYGSNHADPEHWMKRFGETMKDFRLRVCKFLNVEPETKENTETCSLELHKGDLVSIADNAVYYTNRKVPNWVKTQNWYVKEEPKGDCVVIDKNEQNTNSICSPIHKKFLTLVKSSTLIGNKPLTTPYLVKVLLDDLEIRKGADIDTEQVGFITDKGLYTIVEEKRGQDGSLWGKLKSGAGWIPLDKTRKL